MTQLLSVYTSHVLCPSCRRPPHGKMNPNQKCGVTSVTLDHPRIFSVQSKFNDSAKLETACKQDLLSDLQHLGQLSFILRASSDTLPTDVNLCHWNILCDNCDSSRPIANCLCSEWFCHNTDHLSTQFSATFLSYQIDIFADLPSIKVYADQQNL